MAARWVSVPIGSVKPNPSNPRLIKDAKFRQLVQSVRDFPQMLELRPIVVDADGMVLGGNMRLKACKEAGLKQVPVIRADDLTPAQQREFVVKDNVGFGEWDWDALANEWGEEPLAEWGLDVPDVEADAVVGLTDPDAVPEPPAEPVTRLGDRIVLGRHVLMCGDSTEPCDVEKLMGDGVAALVHADPPYGMGKEAEGVLNDNTYGAKLDAFQMAWWAAYRPYVANNASAYIWGNAPDLWRLWYAGGLADSERLELRNEIVWDKGNIAGQKSSELTQYPEASERCLFFQCGNQFLGNVNGKDFPETWEPLREKLAAEAHRAGVQPHDVKRVCGVGMFGHWFTRSQFTLIPREQYEKLAAAYPGCFTVLWDQLRRQWEQVKNNVRDTARSYFNNAHDVMRDVWEFERVTGEDRHGHATPKPVAMAVRVMYSSLPEGGLCVEPFGGTGSTLIAAEQSGRICYTMELSPQYCDVIVKRWEEFTGQKAVRPTGLNREDTGNANATAAGA
jgi:DNA modification methylase